MKLSKLGRKSIKILDGVSVDLSGSTLKISSGNRSKELKLPSIISANVSDGEIKLSFNGSKKEKPFYGTFIRLISGIIRDCKSPYVINVKLIGVGFKVFLSDDSFLVMNLGYSHLVAIDVPNNVEVKILDQSRIEVSGFVADVTSFTSDLKSLKAWDACRQNGVVLENEFLRKKEGKKK